MVERFNSRISDIVNQTRFGSAAELESTLRNYVKTQRALKGSVALAIPPVAGQVDYDARTLDESRCSTSKGCVFRST
jgi:hypothetical protein